MLFTSHYAQFVDSNGDPLSGGVVKFFEPGTSTPKDVYSDGELTTSIGSEVTLDAAGRAVIFLDGNYKVTLEDSAGVEVKTVDDVNVQDDPVSLVLTNPSFETAGDNATDIPGWTLSAPSGVTVERITTDSYHGAACLEITSDGTNAGYAETTDFISVSPGREYEVSFALESSSATVTNTVQVRWFDESQSLVSTTSVYNESSGNPTSFATQVATATPPATARYAKLRAQLGATAGTTRYDDFAFDLYGNTIKNGGDVPIPSILSGFIGNRPAASAATLGRWWYATIQRRWYRDTGSDWEPVFGRMERVLVWINTTQSLTNNVEEAISWTSQAYDVGSLWSSGSPTLITAPRDGVMVFTAGVTFDANGTGNRRIVLKTGGGSIAIGMFEVEVPAATGGGGFDTNLTGTSAPLVVSANDTFKINALQNSGGSLDVKSTTYFAAYYIE